MGRDLDGVGGLVFGDDFGAQLGWGLGDAGEFVGPEAVTAAQAKAGGDALCDQASGQGCEGAADAGELGAFAVPLSGRAAGRLRRAMRGR
jgi:hypothetical protein